MRRHRLMTVAALEKDSTLVPPGGSAAEKALRRLFIRVRMRHLLASTPAWRDVSNPKELAADKVVPARQDLSADIDPAIDRFTAISATVEADAAHLDLAAVDRRLIARYRSLKVLHGSYWRCAVVWSPRSSSARLRATAPSLPRGPRTPPHARRPKASLRRAHALSGESGRKALEPITDGDDSRGTRRRMA